ncbi:phospholipase [Ramlibacter henchirensis]|uniref:Phospholipase A1 n=1 Tax=Ramlibacter henchirensis TaxID=204072 RepID=A0A4Z0CAB5_9BURK|nr:phospholipase A [Ramlibacter henchirensis]TFZ07019.1 phospholipase [Ramlibacter henchirensis]
MPFPFRARAFAGLLMAAGGAHAQEAWQACTLHNDPIQRLACFDRWAEGQRAAEEAKQAPAPSPAPGAPPAAPPPVASADPPVVSAPGTRLGLRLTRREGCRDPRYSTMSRYWELEPGADCGDFGIRGYRPISLGFVTGNTVNRQPTSGNPANNAATAQDYRTTELRLQLSVRTKVAQGLFIDTPEKRDSLWFGYSQQSYWQLFTPALSRPFRSTDHEPEIVYIAPLQSAVPGDWRVRYAGLAVTHHSNGQSLPLSRSWNRASLMLGAERGPLQLHARVWRRLPEDAADDDNPGITNYYGRAELRAEWQAGGGNLWALTTRHSLRRDGRGSVRLEWFRDVSDRDTGTPSGLQLHTQLFAGYGDTLLDYNRRRVMFSIGVSLVDW